MPSGVYVVLFGYCTIILAKRKIVQKIVLGAVIALFLLASADIAVTLFFFFRYALASRTTLNQTGNQPWSRTLKYKFALYIFAKYVSLAFWYLSI